MECFPTLLKAHFQASLLVCWVSGTNKHARSPESVADKRSELPDRGKGIPSSKVRDERVAVALDESVSLPGFFVPHHVGGSHEHFTPA